MADCGYARTAIREILTTYNSSLSATERRDLFVEIFEENENFFIDPRRFNTLVRREVEKYRTWKGLEKEEYFNFE